MNTIAVSCTAALCFAVAISDAAQASAKSKDKKPSSTTSQAVQNAANGIVQQTQAQLGQAVATRVGASLGQQVKAQAAQTVTSQITAQLVPGAPTSSPGELDDLGKQVQGQAAQLAGNVAASQATKLLAPAAGGDGKGISAQVGSQLSQVLGKGISQSLSGQGNSADLAKDVRSGLGQSTANATAATLAGKLGGSIPISGSGLAGGLKQGLQQGMQQGLANELQKRSGLIDMPAAPGLQASLQSSMKGAAAGALTNTVQETLSKTIPAAKQPVAGDLLILGLKRTGFGVPGSMGSFAPPVGSALPVDSDALRAGLNIISNGQGQAGLGVKSKVEMGSKKVEISGALDPNSNSEQGKSAGVQIKIGGN